MSVFRKLQFTAPKLDREDNRMELANLVEQIDRIVRSLNSEDISVSQSISSVQVSSTAPTTTPTSTVVDPDLDAVTTPINTVEPLLVNGTVATILGASTTSISWGETIIIRGLTFSMTNASSTSDGYIKKEDWYEFYQEVGGNIGQVAIYNNTHSVVGYADVTYDTTTKILSLDSIQFSKTPTSTAQAEAKLVWDSTFGTLDLGMPGGNVNLQIGQELLVRIKNDVGAPITNGQVVYFSGSDGANILVKLAKADAASTMGTRTLAMATEPIDTNQHGYVTVAGNVNGLDTSAYTAGNVLFVSSSTAGSVTETAPTAPDYAIKIGEVVRSHGTVGVIFFSQVKGGEGLNNLHDVLVATPLTRNMLSYNTASSRWQNYDPGIIIAAADSKTPPVDADVLPISDSEASSILKKLSWANVKATLKTYFDAIYTGGGGRTKLAANTTYYVRTDGNDTNDGSANDAAHAFLTLQHAVDIVSYSIDTCGYTVTIQLGDGTYTASTLIEQWPLGCPCEGFIIQGNAGDTDAVILDGDTGNYALAVNSVFQTPIIKDLKIQATGGSGNRHGFIAGGSAPTLTNVNFGVCAGEHIQVIDGSWVRVTGTYTISGGATRHFHVDTQSALSISGINVTLSGTPAFSSQFLCCYMQSLVQANGCTFTGAATGQRFYIAEGSVVNAGGASPTYFPGSTTGIAYDTSVYVGSAVIGTSYDESYNAAKFSATGAMTWTVDVGDCITYRYTMITNNLMFISMFVNAASVGGTPSTDLKIKIPNGMSMAKEVNGFGLLWDAGVCGPARVYTVAGDPTWIYIKRMDGANLTAGANNNYLVFQFTVEV
jgi:hypothetical protein